MRIISGRFKGRIIKWPIGIRPTQDKVRKALFDILGDIKGLSFLELYAGSGAVGLEALSQGASKVVFVENNNQCLEIIKKNLRYLDTRYSILDEGFLRAASIEHQAVVITMDVFRAISLFSRKHKKFDIIFLDPPYYPECSYSKRPHFGIPQRYRSSQFIRDESLAKKALKTLSGYDILTSHSLIICQHFKKDILPEVIDNLKLVKQARYGDTVLSFYTKTIN